MTKKYVLDTKNSKEERLGNCWYKGESCYRRIDNQPLDDKDMEHFEKVDLGQKTEIYLGGEGFDYIVLKWERDSSD